MSEIINLNKVRKEKNKSARKAKAEENRVSHGLSKADKSFARKNRDQHSGKLDGKKLDD